MSRQWRMMQDLKRIWLVSSKLTWGIRQILTWALKKLKKLHFNEVLLTKVYNVWANKSTEELLLMALKLDAKFERKLTCAFKMTWRIWWIFVHRVKNSNFILEIKKAELNRNKNSKQSDWLDAVWKLYSTFKNKWIAQLTKLLTHVLQNRCS